MDHNDNGLENNRAHEDELNKLRATAASPSPSALSTASSGSPLVRGSSGGAGKRPAPTSIAAAQLQCQQQQQQQQQQLEFTNRMLGAKRSQGSKQQGFRNGVASLAGGSSSPSGVQQQQQQAALRLDWSMMADEKLRAQANAANENGFTSSSTYSSARKQAKKLSKSHSHGADMGTAAAAATNDHDDTSCGGSNGAHNKSLGYNVAKSIAFKAYRFNEFWSVNKMRYMNLACLLMTLICLVTILIFTGTNSNSPSPNAATLNQAKPFFGPSGNNNNNRRQQPLDDSESLDSLNSQPLVSGSGLATQVPANGASKQVHRDQDNNSNLFDARTRDNKQARRKLHHESQLLRQTEREIEEPATATTTTTTTNTLGQPAAITEPGSMASGEWNGDRWSAAALSHPRRQVSPSAAGDTFVGSSPSTAASSLIDPILNQIFHDMELGNLFRPLKRHFLPPTMAANNSASPPSNTMMMMFKPVIRRSKNGATIVISGGASSLSSSSPLSLNESLSLNDIQLPSLIEKLLPQMLRPISSMSSASGGSPPMLMMTMTMKPLQHHPHQHHHHHHGSSSLMGPLASILDTMASNSTNGTSGSGLASATITLGGQSEPILASASSLPMARLSPFSPLDSFLGNSGHHHHHHHSGLGQQQRSSLFMEPLGVGSMFRSPFGPMFMPPPPPSPSLLGMIMRQASSMDPDDDLLPLPLPPFAQRNPFIPQSQGSSSLFPTMLSNGSDKQQDQQKNDTRQASSHNNSSSISSRHDPNELDTMDSLQQPNSKLLNSRLFTGGQARPTTSGAGSMVIFSSGELGNQAGGNARGSSMDPQAMPFPGFNPFMGMGMGLAPMSPLPPHMVLMRGGSGSSSSSNGGGGDGPLNPILRSILNNAVSEFSSPLFHPAAAAISGTGGAEDRHGNRSSASPSQAAAKQVAAANANANSNARVPSGSSMNAPSWSMNVNGQAAPPQSAIDPDDEWTGVQQPPVGADGSIDRWDEQMQSKHMRARHRGGGPDADSDLESGPFDASDFVTGLQLDQQQQQQQAGGSGPQPIMESIMQTIRGPGLTVERIIEVPSSRGNSGVGQVASGVKSQSLSSRADYEDYESQPQQQHHQQHSSRHLMMDGSGGSTSIFGRPMMESRSDDGPPIGFIGRLLSDLARGPRNDQQQQQQTRTGRGRAFLDEDLDEGDSSDESVQMARPAPPSWPAHVHVGRQLRVRPISGAIESRSSPVEATAESTQHQQEGAIFMAPAQIGSTQELELASPNDIREQPIRQPSRSEPPPQLQPRGIIPQHLIHHHHHPSTENPFTSPSSPLFGFPAQSSSSSSSAAAAQSSNQDQAKGNQLQAPTNQAGKQQNKQPRSFTYHSNHELARPFANANKQQQQHDGSENTQPEQSSEETMGRARFLGPFEPANVVMGRRLDDQPSEFGPDSAGASGSQGNQVQANDSTVPTLMRNQAAFVPAAAIANANSNFRAQSVA